MKIHIKNQSNADVIEFCVGEKEYALKHDEMVTVEVQDEDCVYFDIVKGVAMDPGDGFPPEASERIQKLESALRNLLISADCTWEERGEGHDWAEACWVARRVLGEGGTN